MKRRSLKWLVVCVGLGLVGASLCIWLAPGGGINRMSVLRIKAGMSHEQVEAVIGLRHSASASVGGRGEIREWYEEAGIITVWFDEAGKVTERHFSTEVPSFFDKLYRWIGIDSEPPLPFLPF